MAAGSNTFPWTSTRTLSTVTTLIVLGLCTSVNASDTDKATDDITEAFSGVDVVVDPQSAMLLEGATLDYKDGLQDAGFSIDNPNAQRTCGCGQSFS